jgi:phage shock protein A
MNKLQSYAMAALAAGVLGTAGLQTAALAQDQGPPPGPPPANGQWDRPSHDGGDFAKRAEAHLAKLHADLKLNADQESAWNTFAAKTKPQPHPARPNWSEISKLSTPERLDKQVAIAREGLNRLTARVAVVKQFYAKLTPDQQKTFDSEFVPKHRHEAGHFRG